MTINIITNISGGFGLGWDYQVLKEDLEAIGHKVNGIDFRLSPDDENLEFAEINLFLEVIVPGFFKLAKKQYFIPNPEQWKDEYAETLPRMDRILCKTKDALKIFSPDRRASYLGFRSMDINAPTIHRKYVFLHVAGKSNLKNTQAILDCWRQYQIHVPLVVISAQRFSTIPDNVTCANGLRDGAMIGMMNSSLFHLCPSAYEGFGHTTHEALSCGNIVLSIDAPPMNEYGINGELLIKPHQKYPVWLATAHSIEACEIYNTVIRVLSFSESYLKALQIDSRNKYEARSEAFRKKLEIFFPCE